MPSKADIIEALLFAAERPLPLKKLAQVVELAPREVLAELDVLREEKERIGALQIVEVADGWRMMTKPAFGPVIARLRDEKRARLSRAAFEVLAIVAYRQPATRADIEALRAVDCAGPLQFLLEKKLVAFAGRKEAPGRPWLYATTPQFLDHFGLRSIDDLPSLAELTELNDAAGSLPNGDAPNGDAMNGASRGLFERGAMRGAFEHGHQLEPEPEAAALDDAASDVANDGRDSNGRDKAEDVLR